MYLGAGIAVLAVAVALQFLSRPPQSPASDPPAIGEDEVAATLAALKPPKRSRPLVAMIGINESTEVTDYLMPAGILRRADVADVLWSRPGRVPCSSIRR
jgi:hypothetical protein